MSYRDTDSVPPKQFSTRFPSRVLKVLIAVTILVTAYDISLKLRIAYMPVRTIAVTREVRVPGPIRLMEHCSDPPPCVDSSRSYATGAWGVQETPVSTCPVGASVHSATVGNVVTIECVCHREPR